MKFCYADESGHLGEITVIVGVIVDAMRMRKTKSDWEKFLSELEGRFPGREIEIKGRQLYRGNAFWREWDAGERSSLIEEIIQWMIERRHRVTYGAVVKAKLSSARKHAQPKGFEDASEWSVAAIHLILQIQKEYQKERQNKGNTVFVFDHVSEREELLGIIQNPPCATEEFYRKAKKDPPLDQLIDVPYFADSRHAILIQVADLFAYILHLHAEISEGIMPQKFDGELDRLEMWIKGMGPLLLPDSTRWPKSTKDPFTLFLRSIAPDSLLSVRR